MGSVGLLPVLWFFVDRRLRRGHMISRWHRTQRWRKTMPAQVRLPKQRCAHLVQALLETVVVTNVRPGPISASKTQRMGTPLHHLEDVFRQQRVAIAPAQQQKRLSIVTTRCGAHASRTFTSSSLSHVVPRRAAITPWRVWSLEGKFLPTASTSPSSSTRSCCVALP